MATKFVKGQEVKVAATVPQGPVEALRMDEDGNVSYLISWADESGVVQSRWFSEDTLTAV